MEKKFNIEGMTCSACANRVERVIKKLDGVDNAAVNFATEKLNITIDEDSISIKDIKCGPTSCSRMLVRNCYCQNLWYLLRSLNA